jgi:hypothetical protein
VVGFVAVMVVIDGHRDFIKEQKQKGSKKDPDLLA